MLEFGRPIFLLAGAALALAPLLLHLIARRPPERAPLPTARFIETDARTAIRIERRPTDVLLLILRTLFLLLLALAFAAPRWVPARAGTLDVILLDRGSGMAGGWPAGLDSARALLAAAPSAQVFVFDTVVTRVSASRGDDVAWDSLRAHGVTRVESDYAVALRALAALARETRADSARARLITAPRWGAWSAGFARVRAAAWPGSIDVITVIVPSDGVPGVTSPAARTATVLGAEGGFARAALEALGHQIVIDAASSDLLFALDTMIAEADGVALLERARAGATVVIGGGVARGALADALPWVASAGPSASAPFTFDDGTQLDEAAAVRSGEPRDAALLIAAGSDGRAAAAAAALGDGCLVYFAGSLTARDVALAPGYTATLRRLTRGCTAGAGTTPARGGTDVLPLDSAAREVLAGSGSPPVVPLATLAADGAGRPLARAGFAFALAVALLETLLAYRMRARD